MYPETKFVSKKSTTLSYKHYFLISSKAAKICLLLLKDASPNALNFSLNVLAYIFWILPMFKTTTSLSLLTLTLPISGIIFVFVKSSFKGLENIFWASLFSRRCFLNRTSFCNLTKALFIYSIKGSIRSFWNGIATFPNTPVWICVYKWLTSSMGMLST